MSTGLNNMPTIGHLDMHKILARADLGGVESEVHLCKGWQR